MWRAARDGRQRSGAPVCPVPAVVDQQQPVRVADADADDPGLRIGGDALRLAGELRSPGRPARSPASARSRARPGGEALLGAAAGEPRAGERAASAAQASASADASGLGGPPHRCVSARGGRGRRRSGSRAPPRRPLGVVDLVDVDELLELGDRRGRARAGASSWLRAGVVGAHRHAGEDRGVGLAQADRPVAAVDGEAEHGVDAAAQSAAIAAAIVAGVELRRVHADEEGRRRRQSAKAAASRSPSPPPRCGVDPDRGAGGDAGSQAPGSPSSASRIGAAGRRRLGDGGERVGERRRGQLGGAVVAERRRQPRLRPARERLLRDHDQGHVGGIESARSSHRLAHVADRPHGAADAFRSPSSDPRARGRGRRPRSIRQPASAARRTISSGQPKRRSRSPRASSAVAPSGAHRSDVGQCEPGAAPDHQRRAPGSRGARAAARRRPRRSASRARDRRLPASDRARRRAAARPDRASRRSP